MRLKLRTAERLEDGELRICNFELHPSYTLRIVQGLIDRVIEYGRIGKPEPIRVLLANRQRLDLTAEEFARLETVAVVDEDLAAPSPPDAGYAGDGPEAL